MYDSFATYNGLKLANAVYVVILDHDAFNLSLPRNPERTLHGLASMAGLVQLLDIDNRSTRDMVLQRC